MMQNLYKIVSGVLCAAFLTALLPSAVLPACAEEADASAETAAETAAEASAEAEDSGLIEVTGEEAFNIEDFDDVNIDAEAAVVMDAETGEILYARDADTQRAPASITKVLTALVVLENCELDEEVTFSDNAVNGIPDDSSTAGIPEGAVLTVEQSLYALMIASANEAAVALAEHVSGTVADFADLMNAKAEELGCTNSHFVNPHGYTADGHYVTAHDMALIMRAAIQNPTLKKIMGTTIFTISSSSLKESITVTAHAKILLSNTGYFYQYAECAKTGSTKASGLTLVTSACKDGRELIVVLLHEEEAYDLYADAKALFIRFYNDTTLWHAADEIDLDSLIRNGGRFSEEEVGLISALDLTVGYEDKTALFGPAYDPEKLNTTVEWTDPAEDFGTLCTVTTTYDGEIVTTNDVTYTTTGEAAENYRLYLNETTDADIPVQETPTIINVTKTLFNNPIFFIVGFGCGLLLGCIIFLIVLIVSRRKEPAYEEYEDYEEPVSRKSSGGKTSGGGKRAL